MQESIGASLVRLLILLLILAAIIFAGWNEPLRNRFVSPQQIEAFNDAPPPPDGNWMWEPGRTALEQRPGQDGSHSRYRPSNRDGRTRLDR